MVGSSWISPVPYSSSHPSPYWGPQTSAVNFCEEDYVITRYIAEFINTLTSLLYIGYGIHGIQRRKRRDGIGLFGTANIPYWGLIGVGIFSGLYHTTLKYHTQMMDELSMHIAIGTILIKIFTFRREPSEQRRNVGIILGVLIPFYIYHCLTDEFLLHVILFASMSILVGRMTRRLIAERITEADHKQRLTRLATTGTASAAFGYLIWNIDNHFCSTITGWKHQVGMPLGILLELHGWWHAFTAVAAYIFTALVEFLTDEDENVHRGLHFAWPVNLVFKSVLSANASSTDSQKVKRRKD